MDLTHISPSVDVPGENYNYTSAAGQRIQTLNTPNVDSFQCESSRGH